MIATDFDTILKETGQKLDKALKHLAYSYHKVKCMDTNLEELNTQDLEVWESFVARFSRVSDIFLTRYLRTYVLKADPGFRGSFRDYVNQAEKLGLIDSAEAWLGIRELRNIAAHEYSEQRLTDVFEAIRREASRLLDLKDLLLP